jgi:ATP-dependent DNA ligase
MLSRTKKVTSKGWMIKTLTLKPMKGLKMSHARESLVSLIALLRHILSPMNAQPFGSSLSVVEAFEVSFADLSLSRAHTAGAGIVDDPDGRGNPLRFPRFKQRRPDKSIEQATIK